jgi:hypothetical protein
MMAPLYFILVFVGQWFHFILGTEEPRMDYHPPVNIPMVLAANFGELRPNHFHMGIDIKTNGKEGYSLHSIDDGYVSRVTISPYGYGRVVYINHPGGITSVYAHCQSTSGILSKKIREIQLKSKSSEVEIYFQPNEVKLKKGEFFAFSGNSGSSTGPHLHFEIRDTYTEEALNPLLFGFEIKDTKAPKIYHIKVFSVDKFGYLSGLSKEVKIQKSGGKYTIPSGINLSSEFCSAFGGVGFAINGIDQFDEGYHTCGLYGSHLISNQDTLCTQKLDRVSFEHTRYINSHTDYGSYSNGRKYHKSFHNVANPLKIYKAKNLGILQAKPGQSYQMKYTVFDVSGNESVVEFDLNIYKGEMSNTTSKAFNTDYLNPDSTWTKVWDNAMLEIPARCTYEPIPKSAESGGNSVVFRSAYWPVQEKYTVRLKPRKDYPVRQQYLAVKQGKSYKALPTIYFNGWLEGTSKFFGEITVQVDTKSPTISGRKIPSLIDRSRTSTLYWSMGDHETGLKDYGIYIDGVWEVLEYESKGGYAYFDTGLLTSGEHTLKVVAKDYAENRSEVVYVVVVK